MAAWGAADLSAAWPRRAKQLLWIPLATVVLAAAMVQTRASNSPFGPTANNSSKMTWKWRAATSLPGETSASRSTPREIIARQSPTCDKACESEPDDFLANQRLGQSLVKLGHMDEGILYLRRAIRLKRNDAKSHCDLGKALQLQGKGKIDEASHEFHEAIRVNPDYADGYNNLAWFRATCLEPRSATARRPCNWPRRRAT